ncbi:MAG: alpha/beta hydrolase family protein [Acidobacteriota bacterium]
MKRPTQRLFAFCVLVVVLRLVTLQAQSQSPLGVWIGTLDAGAKLRLVVRITAGADGSLIGKLDSPDQGALGITIDSVTLKNKTLRFELKVIGGVFEGTLDEPGTEISGNWSQGGFSAPLVLKKTDGAPELNRPQEPQKPHPYDEEEVVYENAPARIRLAATLTLPRSAQPVTAVVLLTGSGAQDRDESVAGHRPFLVLSDYLTRKGIAVLRADDRGVGGSTGKVSTSTSEDFASDALAGVAYLKTRKEIDPKRIGLVGHSEGGLVAPLAAGRSDDVAFVVLMAGPGLPGEDILLLQSKLIFAAVGLNQDLVAKSLELNAQVYSILRKEQDPVAAEKALRELWKTSSATFSETEKTLLGFSDAIWEAQIKQVLSPWFRYFLSYDPRPALSKVRCPILAIIGERDLQVPAKQNLAAIESALKEAGHKSYAIRELPGLNHLFQTAKTGAPTEYAQITETISPAVLELIGNWILEKTGR